MQVQKYVEPTIPLIKLRLISAHGSNSIKPHFSLRCRQSGMNMFILQLQKQIFMSMATYYIMALVMKWNEIITIQVFCISSELVIKHIRWNMSHRNLRLETSIFIPLWYIPYRPLHRCRLDIDSARKDPFHWVWFTWPSYVQYILTTFVIHIKRFTS